MALRRWVAIPLLLFRWAPPRPRESEVWALWMAQVHELIREPHTSGKYGEIWHHDCSYMHHPPLGALLYGVEVRGRLRTSTCRLLSS
jgi:alpha-ketoglutarate-dependent taurine dioxygenase